MKAENNSVTPADTSCPDARVRRGAAEPKPAKKYFCPMCEGVESDEPGSCPHCGMSLQGNPACRAPAMTIYTCPMHPEIERGEPGFCPICGMALEPKTISEETGPSAELHDMTRRFWIGSALSVPVFVLAMGHVLPRAPQWLEGDISRWIQFILTTPVVLWAGRPFFQRGWQSFINRSLNMFTLIAIGIGTAYFHSAVVMLFSQIFLSRPKLARENGVVRIKPLPRPPANWPFA